MSCDGRTMCDASAAPPSTRDRRTADVSGVVGQEEGGEEGCDVLGCSDDAEVMAMDLGGEGLVGQQRSDAITAGIDEADCERVTADVVARVVARH